MFHGGVHRQPLGRGMLAGDDDIDVVPAAQAMIHHGEQAIRVRRQIHAHDLRLLVDHMVDEPGILMGEAIVILTPYMGTQQVVEGCDLDAPRQSRRHLQPFRVLVEHGIDDMNEGLVAIEEAVPPGQQVSFEPPFALMLA